MIRLLMIVHGQRPGGVSQCVGQTLFEHEVDDETGHLLLGSSTDYTMPQVDSLVDFQIGTEPTLRTHNPRGAKGVGEVGTIGSPPAVINAVVDALRDYDVTHCDMPTTSQKILSINQGATTCLAAE